MSKRKRYCYVAWDEQIVCAEKGNRVVHYHLKDGFRNSMLAVVGTERSIRHMWYVATDELLRVYGTGVLINGSKQWRARREVVALLSSLVSRARGTLFCIFGDWKLCFLQEYEHSLSYLSRCSW